MTYSVAIRTLGTSPALLTELESIHRQTVLPEKILIYIAEGYNRPEFTVGKEEYKWVSKGMVRQRALPYEDIESEFILFLDDDVDLAPDTAELLLNAADYYSADCVGADTFKNQDMLIKSKLFAAVTNLVFPRPNDRWAFKIHRNGSFTYNNNPKDGFYLSQSCAGPAWLCRRDVFLALHFEDELWLDNMGFAFGDDVLETYKLYKNGFKLGVYYGSGIKNLDAKSSSGVFQKGEKRFYVRSYATFVLWWRMIFDFKDQSVFSSLLSALSFGFKTAWLLLINTFAAILLRKIKIPYYYVKGIKDGWQFVHSDDYRRIPSYLIKERQ